jgi:hypothetical protein
VDAKGQVRPRSAPGRTHPAGIPGDWCSGPGLSQANPVSYPLVCDQQEGGIKGKAETHLINEHMEARHFKMDHWVNIFPFLRKNVWAAKIDLKNAYFHLGLSEALKEFLVLKVGEKYYQFEGAAFDLSTLPQL